MKRSSHVLSIVILIILPRFLTSGPIDISKRPLRTERSHNYDVLHYRIQLSFDVEKKSFSGSNTITLKALQDNFVKCSLDAETFTVTGITQNQKNLKFKQIPHQLIIYFDHGYQFEDTISFTVHYRADNVKADPTKFGMSKRYPIGLTFAEKTPKNPELIQALSFPDGARHWFPCYDHPNDKATQEIIASVPSRFRVLSNGTLISSQKSRDGRIHTDHWHQKEPHPTYLSMLVAGPYRVIRDQLNELPINYWVYEKDLEHARRSFHKTPEIIKFFNKEFGYNYPWAKYDQITIPGIGGGAECTSATLIGQGTIHNQKAEKDFPSHGLVAHETAHQWWGDLVTCRDWGHTWINESFGTYFDYVFTKHDLGEDEGAVNLLRKKNSYLDEAQHRYIRPIVFHRWNFPGDNFDRHTYPKGAAVIHMMRWILGEKPFLKTISHFLHKHAFQSVDTHDFLTAVKEATGQNMDWFFQQWLLSPGHPVFQVASDWDRVNQKMIIKVSQIQDRSKDIPIFKTPVVFKIVTPAEIRLHKVWIKNQKEKFSFPCSQKPLMVRFDEGNYLLKEWIYEKSIEELLYQLKTDDVIGRSWAAQELVKFNGNSRIITALESSAAKDKFWFVRKAAILSLGKPQSKKIMGFLKGKTLDPHSKVRTAALMQLGKSGRKHLVPFFKKRFEYETSYLAQAEALRAIGKCGDQSDLGFLKKAAAVDSHRDVISHTALWAIKELKNKQ